MKNVKEMRQYKDMKYIYAISNKDKIRGIDDIDERDKRYARNTSKQ